MGRVGQHLIEQAAEQLHRIKIGLLIAAADIVRFADLPALQHRPQSGAMIADVEPIAHLPAIAVHRQRFAGDRIGDHQRQKLLWKLIRTVVVGAVGGHRRKAVAMNVGADQMVRGCLGSGVGAVGRVGGGLFERPDPEDEACRKPRRSRHAENETSGGLPEST